MAVYGSPVILGYATPPTGMSNWPPGSTAGMSDGVVVQYQAFGSNNPNDLGFGFEVLGRTTTHEVGHYLGLRHIWADGEDRKSTRLNSSHVRISYAVFCLK